MNPFDWLYRVLAAALNWAEEHWANVEVDFGDYPLDGEDGRAEN